MFFFGDPLIFLPVAAERLRRPRARLLTDTPSLMLAKRGTDRDRPGQIIDLSVMLGRGGRERERVARARTTAAFCQRVLFLRSYRQKESL